VTGSSGTAGGTGSNGACQPRPRSASATSAGISGGPYPSRSRTSSPRSSAQRPARGLVGPGPGRSAQENLPPFGPECRPLVEQRSGGRGRPGDHLGDPLRIAVVVHQGCRPLLFGTGGLDPQRRQTAAQLFGVHARHQCRQRRVQSQRRVPRLRQRRGHPERRVAVRPDERVIGQRFQCRVQPGSTLLVHESQQISEGVARPARPQRGQRLGHLQLRQREPRQHQGHRARPLQPVGQFGHRPGLRRGGGVRALGEDPFQTRGVERAQPLRQT
jgi:hypothetical protein